MNVQYYHTLQEKVYHETMENGLEVYLVKKDGFSKTYGIFATNFGSIDTTFALPHTTQMIKVPDGIAHFLEHKMFEMQDGDASDRFSELGAMTNAFTSACRTAYLFSTGSNELACTKLLLDFVQDIYLTEESVEKEKGIIAQEIKMYDDDPDWQNYFGAIKNLYQKHPLAIDIAGTVESVRSTTKEELEMCYRTFYHPSNMILFVIGHIDVSEMMAMIRENQNQKHFSKLPSPIRQEIDEPFSVKTKKTVQYMDVMVPKLTLAIKVDAVPSDPKAKIERELAINLILDYLFSKSAEVYTKWTKENLINDTFGGFFTQERDYAFIQIGGDTFKVEQLEQALTRLLAQPEHLRMSEEDFKRLKRKTMGAMIMSFNSLENIANTFIRYYFEGINAFKWIDILNDLTYQKIEEAIRYFDMNRATFHVILPNKENL